MVGGRAVVYGRYGGVCGASGRGAAGQECWLGAEGGEGEAEGGEWAWRCYGGDGGGRVVGKAEGGSGTAGGLEAG